VSKSIVWIAIALAAAAAALIAALILPSPDPIHPVPEHPSIVFSAEDPWLIGDREDAFSYAGDYVQTISATAFLQIDLDTQRGMIEFSLPPNDAWSALSDAISSDSTVVLRLQLDQANAVWSDCTINKGSELGEPRLPMTQARYCGSGDFHLLADKIAQPRLLPGFWAIGDALRQRDGSIRNQGLVFSPLLRDQSVFSDPKRTELTLLIYDPSDPTAVVLHLVFPVVQTRHI